MNKLLIGGMILLAWMQWAGCDRERNLSQDEKYLVAHPWRMDSAYINSSPDTTDYALFLLNFLANGKWESTEVDGGEGAGSWSFDEAARELTTIEQGAGTLIVYSVPVLDENRLRLEFSFGGSQIRWDLGP